MQTGKILWGEGLFLRPQHFQQQDAYHEARGRQLLQAANPYGWGLRSLQIDADALSSGVLRIDHVDLIFATGEHYRAPGTDLLPPPIDLGTQTFVDGEIEFHLALPHLKAHAGNCAPLDQPAGGTRYARLDTTVRDLYTDALDASVTVLRKQALLKPTQAVLDAYQTLPLLRVRQTASGSFEPVSDFVPPSLRIGSAPFLLLRLRQLLDALRAKVQALYGLHREPVRNIIEFRSGDVASFWLLHTVSSACAALDHLHAHPTLSPERLFQEYLRLAGALMTFSKTHTLADLPVYDHLNPGQPFRRLDEILRDLLETVISTRYFAIALQESKPAYHQGRLDSEKITVDTAFYLGVSAAQPLSELIESVPLRIKVGAPDDVEKLVLSAMSGVRLVHAPQVPPAVPIRPGACYFELERRGPLYERMLKSQAITLYAPSGFTELKLELIAITA